MCALGVSTRKKEESSELSRLDKAGLPGEGECASNLGPGGSGGHGRTEEIRGPRVSARPSPGTLERVGARRRSASRGPAV